MTNPQGGRTLTEVQTSPALYATIDGPRSAYRAPITNLTAYHWDSRRGAVVQALGGR